MKFHCSHCILALGEKNRIEIYKLLSNSPELSISELVSKLKVNQPTVSHHLKILSDRGLIGYKKVGKFKKYHLLESCPIYDSVCILKN